MVLSSAITTKEVFCRRLQTALKGDYKRARALSEPLWDAAVAARQSRTADADEIDRSDRKHIEKDRATATKADAIADCAQRLFHLLPDGSLGSFLELDDAMVWTATANVRGLLTALVQDAHAWAAKARRQAKRRPGPKSDFTLQWLSEWVAIQLYRAGIPVKVSKNGVFQRVLAAVQEAAGYPERPPANVERDAKRALAHLRSATNSNSLKQR
jgi:hypothetical protein